MDYRLSGPKNIPNIDYGNYGFQPSTVPSGGGIASAVGSGLNSQGDQALSSGNPAAAIAGGALKGAGLLASIYGAYQADKAAREAAREDQRRFNIQQENQAQQRRDNLLQQDFSNDISSGNYAQDYRKNIDNIYGSYYERNRM